MNRIKLLLPVFALAFCISCGSTKVLMSDNLQMSLKRGGCFGSCPVYELVVDNEGRAHYNGIRFTDKAGKHVLQLKKDDLKTLVAAFEEANVKQFKDEYPSNIPDLPLITIGYINGETSKTIKGKSERPREVHNLEKMLEEVANRSGYILVEDPAVKAAEEVVDEESEEEDDNTIDGEFIVKFKKQNGFRIPVWLKSYSQYQVHVKNPLDDERLTWVIQHNTSKISSEDLLKKLQADENLESVEQNMAMEERK